MGAARAPPPRRGQSNERRRLYRLPSKEARRGCPLSRLGIAAERPRSPIPPRPCGKSILMGQPWPWSAANRTPSAQVPWGSCMPHREKSWGHIMRASYLAQGWAPPPRSVRLPEEGWKKGFYRSPGGAAATEDVGRGPCRHRRCRLVDALSDPTASIASANASVVVPHVTLATAALVVARVDYKFCQYGVQLERAPPPAHCRPGAMLLTSSQPLPPLLPPSSPALPRGYFLLPRLLFRFVQLTTGNNQDSINAWQR